MIVCIQLTTWPVPGCRSPCICIMECNVGCLAARGNISFTLQTVSNKRNPHSQFHIRLIPSLKHISHSSNTLVTWFLYLLFMKENSLFSLCKVSRLTFIKIFNEKLKVWSIILFVLILFAKTYLLFCFVIHQALTVLHSPNDIWPRNSPGSILASDWTILITWPQYWPLIGPGSIRNGVTLRDPGDPD